MSRAYLRKDPAFFERKAITQDYPPAAYVALDGVICLAESQPQRGRFRDERLLRALLGKYGRWVPYLIERGDLVKQKDGRLYVEGWDEWQEGDWKVGERVHRIRNRSKENVSDVTPDTVTSDVTDRHARESRPAIAESLTASSEESGNLRALEGLAVPIKGMDGGVSEVPIGGAARDADVPRLQKLAEDLTQHPYVMANVHGGLGGKAVTEQLRPHGFDRVERAWRRIAAQVTAAGQSHPTLRQLVLGADDLLNPVPSSKETESGDRAERERADFDRRVARTRAENARMRGETA